MTFSFTADASGSKDAVTIPFQAEGLGCRTLKIRPPAGHAWSYAHYSPTGATVQMAPDEQLTWTQAFEFRGGQTPLYVALDSGSGTFLGILE